MRHGLRRGVREDDQQKAYDAVGKAGDTDYAIR
jgi:hypothetical protein